MYFSKSNKPNTKNTTALILFALAYWYYFLNERYVLYMEYVYVSVAIGST